MVEAWAVYDLSASGGPERITSEELTHIAAQAKSKVKASARGWSVLSQIEVLALVWLADLFLADVELAGKGQTAPEPKVISNI